MTTKTYYCVAQEPKWGSYSCEQIFMGQCIACAMYQEGKQKPHYPVPALADTAMALTLNQPYFWTTEHNPYAWDGIWRETEEMGWLGLRWSLSN